MKLIFAKVLFLMEAGADSSAGEEICYFIFVKLERVSRKLMTRVNVSQQ